MKNLKEITTIFVNPVPRVSAQGRHKQVFTIIGKSGELIPTSGMQKNKEFGVASSYPFPFNPNTGKLQTGLNVPVNNIFKGLEPSSIIEQYSLSQDWLKPLETIVKQDQLKLQTKFEIFDNVNYGYYTDEIAGGLTIFNSISSVNKDIPTPNFLQKFSILLYDKPNRFTDETARGRLAIQLIRQHSKIAKSKSLLNTSLHDWYISEENEAAIEKMKKVNIIEDAIFALVDLKRNTTPYLNYKLASLITNADNNIVIKGRVNDDRVKETLSNYIGEGQHQLVNIDKFMKLYKMVKSSDKEEFMKFDIMYLVQQGFNTNVLKNRDGYIVWESKSGTPNMYKHSDYNKFVNLLLQEYLSYNVDDKTLTNWYKDLLDEVKSKNVWIE